MIPSIPNSDVVGWVIAPATRCVQHVAERMKQGGTLQRAVIALAGQEGFIQLARRAAIQARMPSAPFDALLREQVTLGVWAKEIIAGDFQAISEDTLVACWSSLEVAVEDTLILLIVRWPPTRVTLATNGVDLRRQFAAGVSEESASRAVKALERIVRPRLAAGPALVEMLRLAGLEVHCAPEHLQTLSELNAVRNCILHRGGVCDARTVAEAPGLGLKAGEPIRVGAARLQMYLKAISEFAVALVTGAVALFPSTVKGNI